MNGISASTSAGGYSVGVRSRALVLAFLAVVVDGFDTAAMSFTIPTLAHDWGTTAAAFTIPIVFTNTGVVLGYLAAGQVSARVGRRSVLQIGVGLFAIGTLVTAAIMPWHSMTALAVIRFLTGLGLGAVLPAGVSFAADHFRPVLRERVSVAVTLGLAVGATGGGLLGGLLIAGVGATGVFWVAGAVTALVFLAMIPGLPAEPPVRDTTAARSGARVSRLFEPATRVDTSLLWAYAFLIFSASYTLISWSPTLMISYGFSRTEAPLGLAFVSLGGIIGGLVLMPVAARIGIMRALILLPALGAVFMVIAAQVPMGDAGMLLVLALSGIGVIAGHIGQTALAVALYPVETRTTGVGWAAALGRGGSLAGPAAAGALLALALSASNIIMAAIVPIIAAILCAFVLWRRNRSAQRPATPEPGPARVEKGVSGGR